jgi:phospholipase/carboxylesterase
MKQSHSGSSRLNVPVRESRSLPGTHALPATDASDPTGPGIRSWQVGFGAVGTIPSNYEPRYAYPLVVWLTDSQCPIESALRYVSALSPQNYVGLAIDDCIIQSILPSTVSASESMVDFLRRVADAENRIVRLIRDFGRDVNFHMDRLFIAGIGDAATTALLIAMHQPDWFAGCIAIDGQFPPAGQLLSRNVELAGRRFLLSSSGGRNAFRSAQATRHVARQLIASGANVQTQVESLDEQLAPSTLRTIDDWILSGILQNGV